MVSGISSISSYSTTTSSSTQALTAQTKMQLQSLGVDTSQITTETQGQAALQEAQSSQSSQQTQSTQQSQQASSSGNNSLKEQAKALAAELGIAVPDKAKLSEIMDQISTKLEQMQAQSVSSPNQASQVAKYQAEYQSLANSVSESQSVKAAQSTQASSKSGASQLQSSLNGLANYNMASISISNNKTSSLI